MLSRGQPSPSYAAAAAHMHRAPLPCLTGGRCQTDVTLNGRHRHAAVVKSGYDLVSASLTDGSFVTSPGSNHLGPMGFGRTSTDVTIGQAHSDSTLAGAAFPRHKKKLAMFLKRNAGHQDKNKLGSTTLVFQDGHGMRTLMHNGSSSLNQSSLTSGGPWRPSREESEDESEWRSYRQSSRGSRGISGWGEGADQPRLFGRRSQAQVLSLERSSSAPSGLTGSLGMRPWK